MGAYAYCHRCEASMQEPTLRQALGHELWACTRCGTAREPIYSEKEALLFALEEIIERLDKLERHLWPENEE